MKLGVNIDHTATLREVRLTAYPSPVQAAVLAQSAGADSIVIHVREDRRHINEKDAFLIKEKIAIPLNLEMSIAASIVDFALKLKPLQATLVPERRRELTTEGGLDIVKHYKRIENTVCKLQEKGVKVSLFVSSERKQIELAKQVGADMLEINTGRYSEAKSINAIDKECKKIAVQSQFAKSLGFPVAAGHGLNYENIKDILKIKDIEELNIGHSIICRAVFIGLLQAIKEMISLVKNKSYQ